MTLRLTMTTGPGGIAVKADGRLEGDALEEMRLACETATAPLTIDLADLLGADASGLALLRQLRQSGAHLVNIRPFLGLLIEEGS